MVACNALPPSNVPPHPNRLRKAVFFDRDGVINVDHGYIDSIARFELMPGAALAIRACHDAGFFVFIVTNQSGIARNYFNESTLLDIHAYMIGVLAAQGAIIDDIRFCPHHPDAILPRYRQVCVCRKPAPGMILDLAQSWQINLESSFLIGDKPGDIEAAAAAGLRGHLFGGQDLAAFTQSILNQLHQVDMDNQKDHLQ